MDLVFLPNPERIKRIPDKTVVLLSKGHCQEQGITIKHVELRLYQQRNESKKNPYSIVTSFVETDEGDTVEDIVIEGFKGPNAIEEVSSYITSHPILSDIILNAVEKIRMQKTNESKGKIEVLIRIMKENGFLTDNRVEQAIRRFPRHLFADDHFKEFAYDDGPLPTKKFQTISQPSVVARMTEWLDVREGQRVLEIGTGSGWQAAILAFLVGNGTVCTVERFSELAEFARKNIEKAGIKNIEVFHGDGTRGLPEKAPFERIMVTASCRKIPPPLIEQLTLGGLLVAPVGDLWQSLVLVKKTKDGIKEVKRQFGYVFVPLVGRYGLKENNHFNV